VHLFFRGGRGRYAPVGGRGRGWSLVEGGEQPGLPPGVEEGLAGAHLRQSY
jgi:hypothetical protein